MTKEEKEEEGVGEERETREGWGAGEEERRRWEKIIFHNVKSSTNKNQI